MSDEQKKNSTLWVVLGVAWRLGFGIAVPLVVLLSVGRWLDRKYNTSPWLLIAGLVLSFVTTNIIMFREAFRMIKESEDQEIVEKAMKEKSGTPVVVSIVGAEKVQNEEPQQKT